MLRVEVQARKRSEADEAPLQGAELLDSNPGEMAQDEGTEEVLLLEASGPMVLDIHISHGRRTRTAPPAALSIPLAETHPPRSKAIEACLGKNATTR